MRRRADQPAVAVMASLMLGVLAACGSTESAGSPGSAVTASPTPATQIGDAATAQALLDEGLHVARTMNTADFWSKISHAFGDDYYGQTLIGSWNLRQGRWEADVTENSTTHMKEFGRPWSTKVRYGASTLYTSAANWPDHLAGRWLAEKVERLDGSDEKLPPLLDALHQARATSVADKGQRVPGYAITAALPAPIALRMLALDDPLARAGVDLRRLAGQATLEVDLDTDKRPRKIRVAGSSLQLNESGALPEWFTELASSATFSTDLTNYQTEVSVVLPVRAELIDAQRELDDPRLRPEVAARPAAVGGRPA